MELWCRQIIAQMFTGNAENFHHVSAHKLELLLDFRLQKWIINALSTSWTKLKATAMHIAKIYAEKRSRISVIALDEEHIYHKTTYTTDPVTWPTACRECHLSWISWHFLTDTMLVVNQVRWLQQHNTERSQNMPTYRSICSSAPLKQWVLTAQRPQPSSRSLERRLHRRQLNGWEHPATWYRIYRLLFKKGMQHQ